MVQYSEDQHKVVCLCAPKVGLVISYDRDVFSSLAKSFDVFNRISITGMVGCRYLSFYKGRFYLGVKLSMDSLTDFMKVSYTPNLIKVTAVLCLAVIIQGALIAPVDARGRGADAAFDGAPKGVIDLVDSGGGGRDDADGGGRGGRGGRGGSGGGGSIGNILTSAAAVPTTNTSGMLKSNVKSHNSNANSPVINLELAGNFEVQNPGNVSIRGNLFQNVNTEKLSTPGAKAQIMLTDNGVGLEMEVDAETADLMKQYSQSLESNGADAQNTLDLRNQVINHIMKKAVNLKGIDTANQVVVNGNDNMISIRNSFDVPDTSDIASNLPNLEFEDDIF